MLDVIGVASGPSILPCRHVIDSSDASRSAKRLHGLFPCMVTTWPSYSLPQLIAIS